MHACMHECMSSKCMHLRRCFPSKPRSSQYNADSTMLAMGGQAKKIPYTCMHACMQTCVIYTCIHTKQHQLHETAECSMRNRTAAAQSGPQPRKKQHNHHNDWAKCVPELYALQNEWTSILNFGQRPSKKGHMRLCVRVCGRARACMRA